MKNKINWWIIAAIIIIGIPIGYVSMGIIERMKQNHELYPVDTCSVCGKDVVLCEYRSEHPNSIPDSNDVQEQKTNIESKITPREVIDVVPKTESMDQKQAKAEVKQQAELAAQKQAKVEAEAKQQAELAAQKQAKVEAESKRQAELAAQKQAKAEAEAKRRVELAVQKQAKAEAEAKRQAELAAQKQAKAEAEAKRQAELVAKAEADRKAKEKEAIAEAERNAQDAAEAKKALLAKIQPVVASGKNSNKLSGNCSVIVNGRKMDYQNFSTGVQYKAYTNVKVTDITTDSKGNVTQIKVTATE